MTLGGSAAPDVSTSLLDYEDAGRTAVLNVTTDFTVAATLTVSGLSFDNFTSVSAAANLELEVLNDGGLSATDDKTKVIVADAVARIVSEMDQLFFEGDPPTPASPIHVTDASTASITAGNDLRIRIPAALDMLWDISVTSVGVSGSAASKVDATVAYEDSGKTLVLNVTTDFAASDHVRLSGLSFTAFIESPPGNLELEVLNDDAVTSTDPRSVTIDPKSKVRVFTAKSTSTENRLEWLNPKSGPYVQTWIVARDDGSFPTGPFDGRFVVSQAGGGLGATDWFVDAGLLDGDHGVLRRLCGSRRRFLLGARIHDGSAVRPHFGPGQMGLQHGRNVDGTSRNPIRWRRGHSLCGLERQGAALDVWRCRWRRLAAGVETRSVPGAGAGAPAGGCLHDRKRDERSGAHRLSRRLGLCDRCG